MTPWPVATQLSALCFEGIEPSLSRTEKYFEDQTRKYWRGPLDKLVVSVGDGTNELEVQQQNPSSDAVLDIYEGAVLATIYKDYCWVSSLRYGQ